MNDDQRLGDEDATDRVESRLTRLGSQSVDVSAARLEMIEARVFASMEASESDEQRSGIAVLADDEVAGVTGRSSLLPRFALVAASILAVLLLSIAVLGTGDDMLVVAAADDVVILLPDGGSVMATDGTELPDDSIVDVTGFVEVGNRRYGPGRYRVDDGRLVPIVDDPLQVVSTDGDTKGGAVDSDPDAPATERTRPRPTSPRPTDRPIDSSTRPTAPPPTRAPTTQPPPTRPPTTTPERSTVPDRVAPQRTPTTLPAPTTTGPPPTRPSTDTASTDTATTVARPTTTTTTVVRRRPPVDEPILRR